MTSDPSNWKSLVTDMEMVPVTRSLGNRFWSSNVRDLSQQNKCVKGTKILLLIAATKFSTKLIKYAQLFITW